MTGRCATVWRNADVVGHLRPDAAGRMMLTYETSWRSKGFPASLSLPLSSRELDAHHFFAGLLPEARARERVCRAHRLAVDDDLGLLLAIGRDCAGVFTVLPEGVAPGSDEPPVPIEREALAMLIESQGQAVPEANERQRFSLAGAQDKVAVRIDGDTMWLPDHAHPSSHILKFETHKRVCLAEYLGYDLARRLGLPVATTSYRVHDDGTPYLVVERYDRHLDAQGRRQRLHQEDMTQALGYSHRQKYEEDGGPGMGDIATLIRTRTLEPVRDIPRLRDWQLFNYFIGNYDAHAKNLALLYASDGSVPELAPAYDLVPIEFFNRIGIRYPRTMALHIGGKAIPEEIGREDWGLFAKEIGVPRRHMLERVAELAEMLPSYARDARAKFAATFGDNPLYDRFEEVIADRCKWTLGCIA